MWWAETYPSVKEGVILRVGVSWVVLIYQFTDKLTLKMASASLMLCPIFLETCEWIPGWQSPWTCLMSSLGRHVESCHGMDFKNKKPQVAKGKNTSSQDHSPDICQYMPHCYAGAMRDRKINHSWSCPQEACCWAEDTSPACVRAWKGRACATLRGIWRASFTRMLGFRSTLSWAQKKE